MEEIFNQIRKAIEYRIYYAALFMTVSIPDICSALESENYKTDGDKYKKWFNDYVKKINPERYCSNNLTSEYMWKFRCHLLHTGQTGDKKNYIRILFLEQECRRTININIVKVGTKTTSKSLLLYIDSFCDDIINGAENWLRKNSNTSNYIKNYEKLIKRYPEGVAPVFGVPVIG